MTFLTWAATGGVVVVVVAAAAVAAGQAGLLRGRAPTDLGVREGRLKAPSASPNSVSSQAELWPGHRPDAVIAPLALHADGAATMARLRTIVAAAPGARIVTERGDYIYAEFTTPLMKYVDDVEFWLDPGARVIHVRSASRLGESDLGLNRRRVEAIRAQLAAT